MRLKLSEAIASEDCSRASMFEVLAVPGHRSYATSFALSLAMLRSQGVIICIRSDLAAMEAGELYGPGLMRLGLDPTRLISARLRTQLDILRAGHEATRCSAVGVVIIEIETPIDLTASRRLKLAAEASGVAVILLRSTCGGVVFPNAAQMRWRVGAAPSYPWLDHRWQPTFDVTLLKHPNGLMERHQLAEWDYERLQFTTAIPQPLAAVLDGRSMAA